MALILVAEDDPTQAELIRRYATAEGHTVIRASDGRTTLDLVREDRPDLLILDLMMPQVDGLDVCRILRSDPATTALPILMVTARASENDLLLGLDLGADDYLTKPFSFRVLMARTRALLRRSHPSTLAAGGARLTVGDLVVDLPTHTINHHNVAIDCTPGEFALLETLASSPGRVFSRQQLLAGIHGEDRYTSARTVDVHIANLRKKLGTDLIRTVYGVGYTLPPS